MQDFSAQILLGDEPAAQAFEGRVRAHPASLDEALRQSGIAVAGEPAEFSLETIRRFRNVVSLQFYGGKRSDHRPLVAALFEAGALMIKLTVVADDHREVELYDGGKRTHKKAAFLKKFQSLAPPDPDADFVRALANRNFVRAQALLPQVDAGSVELDDEVLEILMVPDATTIALHLIDAGRMRTNHRVGLYASPLTYWAAYWGNLSVLRTLVAHGCDPYDANEDGETALHAVLMSGEPEALETTQWVVSHCAANLDPVGPRGSPLWQAYHCNDNTLGARIFRENGARAIPPEGFYDDLARDQIVLESTRHHDLDVLKRHYQDADRMAVLCTAAEHAAVDVLAWADSLQPIDWFAPTRSVNGRSNNPPLAPLYEQAVLWDGGGNKDLALLDVLISGVLSSVEALDRLAVYVAGYNHTGRVLRTLHRYGATFGEVALTEDVVISPLWNTVEQGTVANARVLLELGAPIPPDDEDGTFAERALAHRDDRRAAWQALFSELGMA